MAQMGRPKKRAAERMDTVIKVRVTVGQQRTLEEAARLDGKEVSEFIRHYAVEGARKVLKREGATG
jgi:uncharacterized protein (DUF1778 family)